MIPNAKAREVQSQGVTASASFGISLKDATHIMTILRDTLYSDKVMAVIREYSANAWDANREVGKADIPIKVTVPTSLKPVLLIQDSGPGLSRDDVFNVYTQYGASTKRDSDLAVGMLGIGSKSGFAYSDSFTVISRHAGKKSTYVAVLDESNAGTIQLLHEAPCRGTGVTIQVAVRPEDIQEFHKKARNLYRHFKPRPKINIELPPEPQAKALLPSGAIHEDEDEGWVAVMGCVPYRINLDQLRGSDPAEGLGEYLFNMSGLLYFDIGEVEINASREELKYSAKTNKKIIDKLNSLVEEFVQHTMDVINKDDLCAWDKRIRAQILNRLGLPVPKEWQEFAQSYLSFKLAKDPSFLFLSSSTGNPVSRVTIADKFRILLVDDTRKVKGFRLGSYDILAKSQDKDTSLADLEIAVKKAVKDTGIEGVTIEKLSGQPWFPVVNGVQVVRKKDKKHKVKSFLLDPSTYFNHPYSHHWEIASRVPTDKDVFVLISKFKGDSYNFFGLYTQDLVMARSLKAEVPPVYGYKTTETKPVRAGDCQGIEYREWRKTFYADLRVTHKEALDIVRWMHVGGCCSWYNLKNYRTNSDQLPTLIELLGKDHPICQMYIKKAVAMRKAKKWKQSKFNAVSHLHDTLEEQEEGKVTKLFEVLSEKYPLFQTTHADGFTDLWSSRGNNEAWADYVLAIDQIKGETDEPTAIHNNE